MRTCHTTNSKLLGVPRWGTFAKFVGFSMEYFGPRFKLEVLPNNMDDYNSVEYLSSLK